MILGHTHLSLNFADWPAVAVGYSVSGHSCVQMPPTCVLLNPPVRERREALLGWVYLPVELRREIVHPALLQPLPTVGVLFCVKGRQRNFSANIYIYIIFFFKYTAWLSRLVQSEKYPQQSDQGRFFFFLFFHQVSPVQIASWSFVTWDWLPNLLCRLLFDNIFLCTAGQMFRIKPVLQQKLTMIHETYITLQHVETVFLRVNYCQPLENAVH